MTSKTAKKPIVTLKIESGPVSPAARVSWIRFWRKLVSECKRGVDSEQ